MGILVCPSQQQEIAALAAPRENSFNNPEEGGYR